MGSGKLFAYLPAERKTILANCFRIKFNWGLPGIASGKLLSFSHSVSLSLYVSLDLALSPL